MRKNYILVLVIFSMYISYGQIITTVAGNGSSGFSGEGQLATTARLNLPFNITFDSADNIYIADTYNNSIRKVNNESGIITTIIGTADKRQISELKTPTGLTFDNLNNLYIADMANLRIRRTNIETGKSITLAGQRTETDVPNIKTVLGGPFHVVFDKTGNLYVSVNGDSKVNKIDFYTGNVTTVAGTEISGFSGDGDLAKNAQLSNPTGLALDSKGNLYISDSGNERVRKVDLNTGIISTVLGTGETGMTLEGNLALATKLSNPLGLEVDSNDNLYVVDRNNNRVLKVDISTNIVSKIAGTGESGFSGDGELAVNAQLSNPTGLAFNSKDDLFIVDRGNNRIRKISGLNQDKSEVVLEETIAVFPNPAKDKINIQLKNGTELESVNLFDIRGKQVTVQVANDNGINVSRLPRGIYILRLATSQGAIEQKIVLE